MKFISYSIPNQAVNLSSSTGSMIFFDMKSSQLFFIRLDFNVLKICSEFFCCCSLTDRLGCLLREEEAFSFNNF